MTTAMKRLLTLRLRAMPSAPGSGGAASMPRWKRKVKPYRPYSTAQDSALASRSEFPPRWIDQSRPKSATEASVARSSSSRPPISQTDNHRTNSLRHAADIDPSSAPSPWERHKPVDRDPVIRKRRSDTGVRPPSPRRRRVDMASSEARSSAVRNEAYMRRTLQLPTMKEYPRLPVGLLEAPKLTLHNSLQGLARTQSTFTQSKQSGFICTVTFKLREIKDIQADGEGTTKRNAETAAYLHLLAKLHENGLLKEIYGESHELDKKTLNEERDAKLDIYNYAARYGCVPRITVQSIKGPLIIDGGRKRGRKVSRTGIEVVVEMPEQNIKVSGRGRDMVTAEIAASIKFKEEAERYHAEQGTDSLVIKDSTALNVDNARDFFTFYKNCNPSVRVEVELKEQSALKSNGSAAYEGRILVDENGIGNSVIMSTKRKAEELAFLSAAIELTRQDPSLFPRFLKAPRSSSGEVLKPLNPVDMPVDEDCILLMRDTLLNARRLGLRDEQEELGSEEESTDVRKGRYRRNLTGLVAERRSMQLGNAYAEYLQSPHLAELRRKREELPMNQYRSKVLDIVNNNTYSIIVGATGSGKTTQVPQILLEQAIQSGNGAACNIVCTQPRRIAATSVARRVAEERAERLQETVGYHVRFDPKLPVPGGSVLYCTTGILLQQLQHSPDEVLDGTSHLIIDEVHERDMQIDFLLIILKKVMAQRLAVKKPTPKVVLMSATMNSELFASYFQNTSSDMEISSCPTLSVPGRTFPVKERYLESILETLDRKYGETNLRTMYTDIPTREYFDAEKAFAKENPTNDIPTQTLQDSEGVEEEESIIDWKKKQVTSSNGEVALSNEKEEGLVPNGLIATVIAHLAKTTTEGAILVFLPGLDEMVKVDELLRTANVLGVDFRDESKYKMHMLHSSIAAGQNDVFNPVPQGCRKIILGTNIAETSITIPDVRYVVDTGKLREKRYDQVRRITKLQCTWISKSNSKQRAGRAGRVQDGHYYALFSKARFQSLRAIGLPELLRSDLQETCLAIKAQAFKAPIREFLAAAIEPPPPQAVHAAVLNLQALDALTDEEKLTALGRLLASLPVHPALGKMIILGVVFRCLDPMLILGAAAEERSMFLNPLNARRAAQQSKESFTGGSGSDHIAMLNAFSQMRKLQQTAGQSALWDFSNRYFLHQGAFKSIDNTAKQIEEILVEARIIPYTPTHARANFQYGDPSLNQNSDKYHVIKALALAGFHPNLAVATGGRTFRTVGEKNTIVHPSSVNNVLINKEKDGRKYGTLFTYSTMARSNDGNNIFLRETSESTPLMATLFGGRLQNAPRNQRVLEMDDWLPFYVKSDDRRAVKTIIEFRKALERLLTGAFRDISKAQSESEDAPKRFLAEDPVRECFAEGLVEVLNRDVRLGERTVQRGWGNLSQESNRGGPGSSNALRGGEEKKPRIGLGRWASGQPKEDQQNKRYGSGFGWM